MSYKTEEYDNPNVNAVESAMKNGTVSKQEDHESWECPLVDRVNISPQLARRIKQVRVLNKDKIRTKYMQSRKSPEFESKSKHNQPPPPRKATIPSPRTSTISTEEHEAYMQSDVSTVDFDMNNQDDNNHLYIKDNQEEENYLALENMIQESVNGTQEDASTPFPIVATAQTNGTNSNPDEKQNLIPIHADYEDDLIQGQYDAYGGGSTLNF